MTAKSLMVILFILLVNSPWVLGQSETICLFYDSARAKQAVKEGKPKLFLQGGITPIVYANDSRTEKQFGFLYEEFNDVKSDNDSCLRAYSQVVFSFLDKKHGKVWRRRCRKDVLFLKSIRY